MKGQSIFWGGGGGNKKNVINLSLAETFYQHAKCKKDIK